MDDLVYNTLLAVAAMCNGHFHGTMSGNFNDMHPVSGAYDKGFEKCADVQWKLDAEKKRREAAAETAKLQHEEKQLANGVAAMSGLKFTPEDPPPAPKSPYSGCIVPVSQ